MRRRLLGAAVAAALLFAGPRSGRAQDDSGSQDPSSTPDTSSAPASDPAPATPSNDSTSSSDSTPSTDASSSGSFSDPSGTSSIPYPPDFYDIADAQASQGGTLLSSGSDGAPTAASPDSGTSAFAPSSDSWWSGPSTPSSGFSDPSSAAAASDPTSGSPTSSDPSSAPSSSTPSWSDPSFTTPTSSDPSSSPMSGTPTDSSASSLSLDQWWNNPGSAFSDPTSAFSTAWGASPSTYTSPGGDTLSSIAGLTGTPLGDLSSVNPFVASDTPLSSGDVVQLPGGAGTPADAPSTGDSSGDSSSTPSSGYSSSSPSSGDSSSTPSSGYSSSTPSSGSSQPTGSWDGSGASSDGGNAQLPAWLQPIMQQALQADNLPADWATSNGLYQILSHESSFNANAQNPTSTAYGLFQFLDSTWATVGGTKSSDPYQQCVYGLRYMQQRYGTPDQAWSFWQAHQWW